MNNNFFDIDSFFSFESKPQDNHITLPSSFQSAKFNFDEPIRFPTQDTTDPSCSDSALESENIFTPNWNLNQNNFGLYNKSPEIQIDQNSYSENVKSDEKWTEKDNANLKAIVNEHRKNWKKVAQVFEAKYRKKFTPFILKKKYEDLTSGQIKLRVKFTLLDDLKIAKYFELYAFNWQKVAGHFTGRDSVMLKNRYYAFIKKKNLLDALSAEAERLEKVFGMTIDSIQHLPEETYAKFVDYQESSEESEDGSKNMTTKEEHNDDLSEKSNQELITMIHDLRRQLEQGKRN